MLPLRRFSILFFGCLTVAATAAEKPVALIPGLGVWQHPIATRSPMAQKFFDQGLSLVYGFNRYEALRSFRKAAELDPQTAMAYWGMAQAQAPYINMDGDPSFDMKESCASVEKGLALPGVSAVERAYLEAAATRCPDFGDPARYVNAMRKLAEVYPDDLDAQVLLAEALMIPVRWKWYGKDGKPAEGVAEAERVLEGVLRRNAGHAGANHFYIHAVESSPTPERAVASSQRLMGLAPAAGHVVHMPGHIWLAMGDFDNTVAVNERAAEVDRRYFAQTGVDGSYTMYYLHNLQFILYARQMQGRLLETRKAERVFQDASAPMAKAMPEMGDVFNAVVTMAELRMYRWDELLAAPKPKTESPLTLAMWHYSRAISLARKADRRKRRENRQRSGKCGARWTARHSGA
jgi:tetratricopeptide (TPR) repeat protein